LSLTLKLVWIQAYKDLRIVSEKNKSQIILDNCTFENESVKQKCLEEIKILEETTGNNGIKNIDLLYNVFEKHKSGKPGNENKLNSWLYYALGLTSKKPEGDGLKERRFFARPTPPDIDTDFPHKDREKVIDYLKYKYGENCVAIAGTYSGLKLRSVVTRVVKALDVADAWHQGAGEWTTANESKKEEILSTLPARGVVKNEKGEQIEIKKLEDAYRYVEDFRFYMDKYPELYEHAKKIEGLTSDSGTHASGIVITDKPISNYVPRMFPSGKGSSDKFNTQYEFEDCEEIGLVKYDFLGLRTWTIVSECISEIKKNYSITIDPQEVPLDDSKTFDIFKEGLTMGVFQCESEGMKRTCREVSVDRFEDIVAILALYRPGPMDFIENYVNRKHGRENIDYFHPKIEPYIKNILAETYGIPVYQESIMLFMESLGGLKKAEALALIKGISKKKIDQINIFKPKFVDGAKQKGIEEELINSFWDEVVVPFSNYGFNKSHSLSYGLLSQLTAYLKAHYPDEFFLANLNVENEEKEFDKVKEIIEDFRNFDIEIGSKNINDCGARFKIVQKKDKSQGVPKTVIAPPLLVKGVGEKAALSIENNAPYKDLKDFAIRTGSEVTKGTVEGLIEGGFFNDYIKKMKKMSCCKKMKKEELAEVVIKKFNNYREDAKKMSSKGLQKQNVMDMF